MLISALDIFFQKHLTPLSAEVPILKGRCAFQNITIIIITQVPLLVIHRAVNYALSWFVIILSVVKPAPFLLR